MKVLRDNRVIQEYAPKPTDTGARVLAAIRQAERCGEVPSVRQLVKACGLSSTSIVLYWLRRLARDGDLELGAKGTARSYRLTDQGRGGPSDTELLARCLDCLELADVCDPLTEALRARLDTTGGTTT